MELKCNKLCWFCYMCVCDWFSWSCSWSMIFLLERACLLLWLLQFVQACLYMYMYMYMSSVRCRCSIGVIEMWTVVLILWCIYSSCLFVYCKVVMYIFVVCIGVFYYVLLFYWWYWDVNSYVDFVMYIYLSCMFVYCVKYSCSIGGGIEM